MRTDRIERVVVITGASAGVGRATAREFARQGARIGLLARDPERLALASEEVNRLGGVGLAIPCDVADADAVEAAAQQVETELGQIDVWVNNAMVSALSPVSEMTSEDYRRITEVTYLGAVNGTLSALRRMRQRNSGVIVQVGSALSYRAIPLQSAYCAAKHAMRAFTDSLRVELMHEKSNIHVTSVHLPAVNTPQFEWLRNRMPMRPQPIPPIFQPELAAEAIVWSTDAGRREVCLGFSTVRTIWGNKFIPSVADWVLSFEGFSGQQDAEADDPDRPDNLYDTVSLPIATHGRFGEQSTSSSPQFWMNKHRATIGLAAGAGALLGGASAMIARLRN